MLILDRQAPPPTGFGLFNLGFRPFFLAATLWAALAMALALFLAVHAPLLMRPRTDMASRDDIDDRG